VLKYSVFIVLFFISFSVLGQERETDLGAIFTARLNKDLNRFFGLSFEQEVRLLTNNTGFDRSKSGLGVDYTIIKGLKAGVFYNYIYMYNSDFLYESRHRYYANLSYKYGVNRKLTLTWRARFQGTYRDENRGEYKINPKYVLRNRLEAEYNILGTRWKPYLSAEATNSLNDPLGNEIYKLRFQGGTSWRLDRTTYLEFYLRADEYLVGQDSRVISIGVGYKKNL
jgi:hypothetical protein